MTAAQIERDVVLRRFPPGISGAPLEIFRQALAVTSSNGDSANLAHNDGSLYPERCPPDSSQLHGGLAQSVAVQRIEEFDDHVVGVVRSPVRSI